MRATNPAAERAKVAKKKVAKKKVAKKTSRRRVRRGEDLISSKALRAHWERNQLRIHLGQVAHEMVEFLLDKNRKYGDSALNPIRAISKASADEQLKVRMDDKISRLVSAQGDDTEDPLKDLVGYWFLQQVLKMREEA